MGIFHIAHVSIAHSIVHDSREAKGLIENKRALSVFADKGYDSQSVVVEIKNWRGTCDPKPRLLQ